MRKREKQHNFCHITRQNDEETQRKQQKQQKQHLQKECAHIRDKKQTYRDSKTQKMSKKT